MAYHLERGLRYAELGEYALAVLEFEQVMQIEFLSADNRERAEAYAEIARRYDRGEPRTLGSFIELGGGYYRENTTDSTRAFGGSPARDAFAAFRADGWINYLTHSGLSLDGSLDVRYREYDNSNRRDDRDLRWNGSVTRSLQDGGSVAGGVRGRASYRGDPGYRHDYALFVNRGFVLDSHNQFALEMEVRRREYPSELSDRDFTNAGLTATWSRASDDGRSSVGLSVRGGYEWAANDRLDGDNSFYGASIDWNGEVGPSTSIFLFGWYEHNGYHQDSVIFDEDDVPAGASSRADDLFEFGGGTIHRIADGWTLRPQVLYIRDESSEIFGNYSSTEIRVHLRRAF